jgi:dihydrofolate reductase
VAVEVEALAAEGVGCCLGLGVAVEVEAIAAQEVDHCLGFGVGVEVEAIAAQGVGCCLGFGVAVEVEAIAAEGVGHCLGFAYRSVLGAGSVELRPMESRNHREQREVVMRDVILYMSMSLDGFVGSDREHPGMAVPDAELKQWKLDRISWAGAHLMGRITYQEMSSYWPQSDDPYAPPMNDIPKVVFSKTLSDAEATWPETRVARGDLTTEIAAIKAEPGSDVIVWGGSRLAGALAAANLIDEYRLLVQPLVLGCGQALFDQLPESRHLDLVEATPFPSGTVVHIYRRQHT